MNETYVEWLVKRKNTVKGLLMRALFILLIVACVGVFLFYGVIGLMAEVIVCFITYKVFVSTSVEYEYCYLTGELIIDKVMGKVKRKRCVSIDMNTVELVAPRGNKELEALLGKCNKTSDYSTLMDLSTVYTVIFRKDSDVLRVDFEPNEKMIDAMQMQYPRKVIK